MLNDDNEISPQKILSAINQKLARTSSKTPNNTNDQLIFRIDKTLRMTDEAAYEPEMVSIGPYHRGKSNLQKMEKYKSEFLKGMLDRLQEMSADRYIDSLLQDEQKARSYYAEPLNLSREDFVEMMLLDGCFIIEILRKSHGQNDGAGPIFGTEWVLEFIRRDLLLFENQIPFFILRKLFDMTTKISNNNPTTGADSVQVLISLATSFLNGAITDNPPPPYDPKKSENVYHLLDLMYKSFDNGEEKRDIPSVENGSISNRKNYYCPPEFSCINFRRKNQEDEEDLNDIVFIKSVTELDEDGIKFGKEKQSKSWLDIKFENGEIKIPPLVIQDGTESILRNLIAYEQYMFDSGSSKYVTDYATFMDCLINTAMDVQKLRVKGIIKNWLGNDEEVTEMFNKICKNVVLSPSDFTYRKHFKEVNYYCNRRCNLWMSYLKRTYFKNPWTIFSLIGAILLLILTLLQTVLSFLEHFKKDPKVVCIFK